MHALPPTWIIGKLKVYTAVDLKQLCYGRYYGRYAGISLGNCDIIVTDCQIPVATFTYSPYGPSIENRTGNLRNYAL